MEMVRVLAIISSETELGKDVPICEMFLAHADPAKFRNHAERITQRIGLEAMHDRLVCAIAEEDGGEEDGEEET